MICQKQLQQGLKCDRDVGRPRMTHSTPMQCLRLAHADVHDCEWPCRSKLQQLPNSSNHPLSILLPYEDTSYTQQSFLTQNDSRVKQSDSLMLHNNPIHFVIFLLKSTLHMHFLSTILYVAPCPFFPN